MVGQHWVTDIFLLLAPGGRGWGGVGGGEEMCLDKKHEEGLGEPVFGVTLRRLVQTEYSNNTHAFRLHTGNGSDGWIFL